MSPWPDHFPSPFLHLWIYSSKLQQSCSSVNLVYDYLLYNYADQLLKRYINFGIIFPFNFKSIIIFPQKVVMTEEVR